MNSSLLVRQAAEDFKFWLALPWQRLARVRAKGFINWGPWRVADHSLTEGGLRLQLYTRSPLVVRSSSFSSIVLPAGRNDTELLQSWLSEEQPGVCKGVRFEKRLCFEGSTDPADYLKAQPTLIIL